jgi:ADP-ribose pyrophosphatase
VEPEVPLASRRVFEGRVVNLRVDRVGLPGRGETVREVVEHRGAAVIVPVTDAGEILMVRQYRYAVGEALLEVPAGTLDAGEAPLAAAARELLEEVGARASRWEPLAVLYPSPGVMTEVMHLFLATGLTEGRPQRAPDEVLSIERVPLPRAVEMVRGGEIRDAKSAAGILLLAQRQGD